MVGGLEDGGAGWGAGWRHIAPDPALARWAAAARPVACKAIAETFEPWRCGGTWLVGLDALPNAPDGSIAGVPLPWEVLGLRPEPLHPAQLSTIRPGYPQPSDSETPSAFAFRRNRGAAHLDGLIADAHGRRRIAEPHGWILGLPLTDCSADAAPLTIWEGSHAILRAALLAALAPHPPESWGGVDITDAYAAARRQCFDTCRRIDVAAQPGAAILMHRLCLHGVSPWGETATAPPEGRIIAYFRPLLPAVQDWLQ